MKDNLFTQEELTELKSVIETIGSYLPKDKTNYIWSNYIKIKGKPEPTPCTCPSSGKLWGNAINTIKEYLKNN